MDCFTDKLSSLNVNLSEVRWTEEDTENMYSELLNSWISTLSDNDIIDAIDGNLEELDTIDILQKLDKNKWLGVFVSWVFQHALGV